jgi:molybdopterin-guanine dinucleotide biosynthesis protein A
MGFAAVVLAGGAARRLGGAPKPARTVAGVPLLIRVLDAVRHADPRIVVGPPLAEAPAAVRYTREDPPGGGPVAATAAGLALVGPDVDLVAVLGADLPFLSVDAVDRLRRAISDEGHEADVAVYADGDGRAQWMCGVWRRSSLLRRLAEIGEPAGLGMRRLADGLRLTMLSSVTSLTTPDPPVWFDCDTEDDLRRAEEWAYGR